ncbi:type II toxin-antitoxin system Phd/YefM family antitoxin [Streptomyces sp. NPDC096339]|uniref:type II toxin-antitoxin system Phd/YefM family antitoxin n=1 Tax=Streptomyces sp. NPDC096339 TaxID=3366086 RepID=UPI003819A54C
MDAARQYDVHEAEAHFPEILDAVARGEEVIISRAGEPVAKVVPPTGGGPRTARGTAREPVVLDEDFDDMSVDPGFPGAFGFLPDSGDAEDTG